MTKHTRAALFGFHRSHFHCLFCNPKNWVMTHSFGITVLINKTDWSKFSLGRRLVSIVWAELPILQCLPLRMPRSSKWCSNPRQSWVAAFCVRPLDHKTWHCLHLLVAAQRTETLATCEDAGHWSSACNVCTLSWSYSPISVLPIVLALAIIIGLILECRMLCKHKKNQVCVFTKSRLHVYRSPSVSLIQVEPVAK